MNGKRFTRIAIGFIIGGIYGLASVFIFFWVYTGFTSFSTMMSKENSLLGVIFMATMMAMMATFLLGVAAANTGAIVGAINGATNGGIGAGLEWIFITGCASMLGAWLWRIDLDNYIGYGIIFGITGGIVGWLSWFLFHTRGKKNKLTPIMLVGYLCAFTYIAVVTPILTEFMVLVLDD